MLLTPISGVIRGIFHDLMGVGNTNLANELEHLPVGIEEGYGLKW